MSKLCLESVENRETTEIDDRLDIYVAVARLFY